MPPRRRDFRLAPEQAEQLTGSVLTRLLRRVSLRGATAFRPAAAGLLSAGLVFVLAGYAWPEGGSVSVESEMTVVPAAVEDGAELTLPPFEDLLRFQAGDILIRFAMEQKESRVDLVRMVER